MNNLMELKTEYSTAEIKFSKITPNADFLHLPNLNLEGKKIVITLGGTEESIDKVRMIKNKSTGRER